MQKDDELKQFKYTGRDSEGKKIIGIIRAGNEEAALLLLRPVVAVIIDLKELQPEEYEKDQVKDTRNQSLLDKLNAYRPSLSEKAFLAYQIAAMLDAGLDLLQVIDSLAEEAKHKKGKEMLEDISKRIEGGASFSEALQHYPAAFNTVFVSVVRAGEESGKLGETMKELSNQLDNLHKIRGKIISALAYPVFTFVVAIGVGLTMLLYVLPMFENIYSSFGSKLPIATRTMISISHVLRDHYFLTTLAVLMIVAFWYWLWQKPDWRLRMEWLVYKIPVFGPLLQEYIYVQICRVLSLTFKSGIHIQNSLQFTSDTMPWLTYRKGIDAAVTGVAAGETVSSLFIEHKVLPGIAAKMVAIGEKTGMLDNMLDKVADYYDERVSNKIKILSSLLEPFMIVALGGFVGLMLIAMYMPIFYLGKAMKGHM